MYTDRELVCADCGQPFVFSASEQEFFATKQFTDPKRCRACRDARKASRDNGSYDGSGSYSTERSGGYSDRSSGPREMFAAVCSTCGNQAQVPFRPTSGKPVYCSDCFRGVSGR